MFSRLQTAIYTTAAVLLVLIGAYAAGSRAAKRSMQLQQERQRTNTIRKAREVTQELDTLDDAAIRKRADRWVRGSK